MSLYHLIRPLLFCQDAERVHDAVYQLGILLSQVKIQKALSPLYSFEHPVLETQAFGLSFPNPIGLSSGFCKDTQLLDVLHSLGFGFVEIRTVSPQPQEGNPKPRLFRLPHDCALINRLGFSNIGVQRLKEQLQAWRNKNAFLVGASIVKGRDTPNEQAFKDYRQCFEALKEYVDYVAINVSSPNTPGVRDLQGETFLSEIFGRLQEVNRSPSKPLLLKIAPDLTHDQLNAIIRIVQETGISGIIATNTTTSRQGLLTSSAKLGAIGQGGLSGQPLKERATAVIRHIYKQSQGTIPIIGVGGVFSAEDAYEKIRAGASLVQLYTGLVYEGPGLVKRIKQGLVRLLLRDGFSSIQEAVGIDAPW